MMLTDPLAFFLIGIITGGACALMGCIAWYFWDSPDGEAPGASNISAPHVCTFSWRRGAGGLGGFVCDRCDRQMEAR